MQHIQAIPLRPGACARRINPGRALAAVVTLGLALVLTIGMAMGAAVGLGIAPTLNQTIELRTQHVLVIHYGPRPTCAAIPNPPQHDCFQPGFERREFSVDYLTPQGARSLVWFRLPAR